MPKEAYHLQPEQGCCGQFPFSDGISLPTKGMGEITFEEVRFVQGFWVPVAVGVYLFFSSPLLGFTVSYPWLLLIKIVGCEQEEDLQDASALLISPKWSNGTRPLHCPGPSASVRIYHIDFQFPHIESLGKKYSVHTFWACH